jgi:hypothetical protein
LAVCDAQSTKDSYKYSFPIGGFQIYCLQPSENHKWYYYP